METSIAVDTESAAPDSPEAPDAKVVLRVDRFDIFMARRGAKTPREQAELLGMRRTHLLDIRAGRKTPSLPVALRLAEGAGARVEELFGVAA